MHKGAPQFIPTRIHLESGHRQKPKTSPPAAICWTMTSSHLPSWTGFRVGTYRRPSDCRNARRLGRSWRGWACAFRRHEDRGQGQLASGGSALALGDRQLALLRQSVKIQQIVQLLSVRRAVEASVKAAPAQVGERLPAAPHQRNSDACAAAGPHDLVAEHKPVPVLDDANESNPEPSQKC